MACKYSSNGKDDVFTLILDLAGNPYDEYFCDADQSLQQVNIKGCTLSSNKRNESKKLKENIAFYELIINKIIKKIDAMNSLKKMISIV